MTETKEVKAEVKPEEDTEEDNEEVESDTEESDEKIDAKYIRYNAIKAILKEDETKIRVSAKAKSAVIAYFDRVIEKGAKELIAQLPRKVRGENKGKLIRITISSKNVPKEQLSAPVIISPPVTKQ